MRVGGRDDESGARSGGVGKRETVWSDDQVVRHVELPDTKVDPPAQVGLGPLRTGAPLLERRAAVFEVDDHAESTRRVFRPSEGEVEDRGVGDRLTGEDRHDDTTTA